MGRSGLSGKFCFCCSVVISTSSSAAGAVNPGGGGGRVSGSRSERLAVINGAGGSSGILHSVTGQTSWFRVSNSNKLSVSK